MRKLFLLATGFLFVSCASTGDLESIRLEIKNLQVSNRENTEILGNFTQKYDSQLREELDKNIRQIQFDINRLEAVKAQAAEESSLISEFRSSSERDSIRTTANRVESDSQNVVREFNSLRVLWEQQLKEMHWLTETAQKSSADAQAQTQVAKLAVLTVEEKLTRLEILSKKLENWSSLFDSWSNQAEIQKTALRTLTRDLSSLTGNLENYKARIDALEAGAAALKKRVEILEKP